MTNKTIKYDSYNKISLLIFDIENALDKLDSSTIHTIRKIFFYFSKSGIVGKFTKPFLIRFFIEGSENENSWGINEIYSNLHCIPKFLLSTTSITNEYYYIDLNNKIFPIKKLETIEKCKPYTDEAYEFEVNYGSALVSQDVINALYEILETYEIEYDEERDDNDNLTALVLYPDDASYHIHISTNGKTNKAHTYEITPNVQMIENVQTIGKFTIFNNHPTAIPNDDNIALIRSCCKCKKNIILNWWETKRGTRCPYCGTYNATI